MSNQPEIQQSQPIGSQTSWCQPLLPGQGIEKNPVVILLVALFLIPGGGHFLLGQTKKGLFYIIFLIIANFILAILIQLIIGLCLLPVLLIYVIMIAMDAYHLSVRLQKGAPGIMQGECTNSWALFGINSFVAPDPCFLNTDPSNCPQEWQQAMANFKV